MKILLKSIIFIVIILFLSGCNTQIISEKTNKEKEKIPYEKFTLNDKEKKINNQEWEDILKSNIVNVEKLSEITANTLLKNGEFKEYNIELAGKQYYDENQYQYKISADIVMWQSDEYYAICEIKDKEIESLDKNTKIIKEPPFELWVSGIEEMKIYPTSEVIDFEIGTNVSFSKNIKNKEIKPIGPFTIVYKVNVSSPSSQVLV